MRKRDTGQTKTCEHCGQNYTVQSGDKGRFCSRKCWRAWQETVRLKLACGHCGKEFEQPRWQPRKYCSLPCYHAAHREESHCEGCGNPITVNPSVKQKYCNRECRKKASEGKKATTVCPTCKKEFEYRISWPRKYCSNVCHGKANVGNIKRFAPSAYETECEQCGKRFTATPATSRGRFCSQSCMGKWQSAHIVGEAHPLKGKKPGRPKHLGPPIEKHCAICGIAFIVGPKKGKRRRCCSFKCAGIYRTQTFVGPNHPAWKGGRLPYYGPSWYSARRACRKRDGKCMDCGALRSKNGAALDVHHIIPFRLFGPDRHRQANDLANLVALCKSCHSKRPK